LSDIFTQRGLQAELLTMFGYPLFFHYEISLRENNVQFLDR